jgi:hypothetical protein
MPVRIKPVRDLGKCTLSLESIKGICDLMEKEFGEVSFSAEDGVWEVFNESKSTFLQLIADRDKLARDFQKFDPLKRRK